MELIYLNHEWKEQGQLLDFSLDLAYGRDENDFEIVTPKPQLSLGDYFYIKDTNYGGVIDEIVANTSENVVYRGRSLEGILASFSVAQLTPYSTSTTEDNTSIEVSGSDVSFYGRPTAIIGLINMQLDEPFVIVPSELEEEPIITATVDRSLDIYQALRLILEPQGIKPRLRIRDRNLEFYVEGSFNYASGQYFDLSQYRLNIKVNENIPNHIIGIYRKEGNTIVKHIYTDETGVIQPYFALDYRVEEVGGEEVRIPIHDVPLHNGEYERVSDTENKVVTGIDEVVLVVEAGSTAENWDVVTPLSEDNGNTPFNFTIPADWDEKCYTDYYKKEIVEEQGVPVEDRYVNFQVEEEYTPVVITEDDTWWRNHFTEYYTQKLVPQEYGPPTTEFVRFTLEDATYEYKYTFAHAKGHLPSEWSKYYNIYYTRRVVDNVEYFDPVEGVPDKDYSKQTRKPTDWSDLDARKNYYIDYKRYKWKVTAKFKGKKMQEFTIYDSLKFGNINKTETFDKYFSSTKKTQHKKVDNTDWYLTRECIFSGKATIGQVAEWQRKKIQDYSWQKGKYYELVELETKHAPNLYADLYVRDNERTILHLPSKTQNVYELTDSIKPPYTQGEIYRRVTDDYTALCQAMLDKYTEILNQSSSVEAKFESDDVEFDVGDVVGAVHPYTQQQVQSTIQKKIVKITPATISSVYEV